MSWKELLGNPSVVDDFPSLISSVDRLDKLKKGFDTTSRISFLRNFSIEQIEPFLKFHLYRSGIRPIITMGNYDVVEQEILDEHSYLYQFDQDVVVLSLVLDQLCPNYNTLGWNAKEAKEKLSRQYELLVSKTKNLIIVNTFPLPFLSKTGIVIYDNSNEEQLVGLNQWIREYVLKHSAQIFLADWDRFVRQLGEKDSMDYRYWFSAKAPFKTKFLNLYAIEIKKIVCALKGKPKKCLVLDCDNTLWGGVIGEEGVNGIKLDRNDYPGNVFYEFQRNLIYLIERGVLITLCSQNNEEDVWEVLNHHPYCVIKRDHIAGWRINWDNKANNLIALAKELNIGLDSCVFLDDDSTNCELIENLVPEVTVIQVPKKLHEYPEILFKEGLFDTLTISPEDRQRNRLYQIETKRRTHKKNFKTLESFQKSLELKAIIHSVKDYEIPRVAQLTQKTNQFNLTTRRYSESEVRVFAEDACSEILTLSVKDKFGDLGLTGVFIAKFKGPLGIVDTLLLSCRILGRQLELAFVGECLQKLEQEKKLLRWQAEFLPTKKNQQVNDFWDKVGFNLDIESEDRKLYSMEKMSRDFLNINFILIETD